MTSSPVGPTTLLSGGTHIHRHLCGSLCNPVLPALFLGHGTMVKEQKSSEHFRTNRQSFLMPVVRKVLERGYTGPKIRRKCPCPSNLPRRGCGARFLASPCRPGCLCARGRGGRGDVYLVLQQATTHMMPTTSSAMQMPVMVSTLFWQSSSASGKG